MTQTLLEIPLNARQKGSSELRSPFLHPVLGKVEKKKKRKRKKKKKKEKKKKKKKEPYNVEKLGNGPFSNNEKTL